MSTGKNILELKNISKTFPGVVALKNVDFSIRQGEVHALLGENGAGKSTLIKIISGYHQPDPGGELFVNGEPVVFKNPRDAILSSISTIYQELTLCPAMTVAENLVLDKQDMFAGFRLRNKDFREVAVKILNDLGQSDIDPDSMICDLAIAQQQVVEIAKAVASDAKVILMDEPTSSLSESDADKLMNIIKGLRTRGVSVIYISHRLHEIDKIADRITVLRDGEWVGTVNNEDVTESDLVAMMVGRELTNVYPKRDVAIGDVVLKVDNMGDGDLVEGVSFEVRKGEILGVGGLVGSRRTEMLQMLFGLRPIVTGQVELNGKPYKPKSSRDAIKNRMALVTEDRKHLDLITCLPVYENINLVNVQQSPSRGIVNWTKCRAVAERQRAALNIRVSGVDQIVVTLSGGNQQKVALAKWLDFNPQVILFDEPTRGIDIGAKTEIYSIMGELVSRGTAIIMVSSELPELVSVADRVLVMQEGRMMGIVEKADLTQENVMSLATLKSEVSS